MITWPKSRIPVDEKWTFGEIKNLPDVSSSRILGNQTFNRLHHFNRTNLGAKERLPNNKWQKNNDIIWLIGNFVAQFMHLCKYETRSGYLSLKLSYLISFHLATSMEHFIIKSIFLEFTLSDTVEIFTEFISCGVLFSSSWRNSIWNRVQFWQPPFTAWFE